MDKVKANKIAARAAELLAPMEAEFNIKVLRKKGSFDDTSITNRFEFVDVETNGVAMTRELTDLQTFRPDLVDVVFNYGRLGDVKFVGYYTRRSKYPFVFEELSTGKRYKATEKNAEDMLALHSIRNHMAKT